MNWQQTKNITLLIINFILGLTALHLAAQSGQSSETIQTLLLHSDIDVKLKNNSDETAYDIAIRKGRLGKYFEIAEPCFNFV